ncbi:MAG: DUF4912 domain-containing protein [Planctomycetaceae bacterium]
MTTACLREKPVRDLARMAKQHGVPGWHSMRKDQLIRALVRRAKSGLVLGGIPGASGPGVPASRPRRNPASVAIAAPTDPEVVRRIAEARERLARAKNLATRPEAGRANRPARDRMVLMVRGPYWMHAFWEITPRSISRAQAALGQEWHSARPVLRVLRIETASQASPAARVIREIEVHGGVKNWFIDVREPMRCKVEIGYLTSSGRFHGLARSNAVTTPPASQSDTLDVHWGEILGDCDRIYAMSGGFSPENNSTELQELFEERLRRPMVTSPRSTGPDDGDNEPTFRTDFQLDVDAEMVVYGVTQPDARVTLQGEPVRVQSDGTFRVRVDMPNKRQVLPIIATAPDGGRRQMIVMAVERNTKSLEPHGRDALDLS